MPLLLCQVFVLFSISKQPPPLCPNSTSNSQPKGHPTHVNVHLPLIVQVKLYSGLSIEIQPDPVPAQLPTEHRPSVNCGISILYEIQWAFHFQHKPKLVQVSVWRRLCHEAAVCIKITLYCFDMSEAKVKIIFLLDIVSVILPRCRAAIRTSPE